MELLRKDKEPDSESQATLLKGIATGLKGWRKAPAPSNWTAVSALLAKSKNSEVQTLTRELSLVFGDGRALDELRTIAANDGATPDERRAAVRALVVARDAQLVPTLQKLVGHRELAIDAIRGLAAFDHPDTSALLVGRFNGLLAPARREAVDTLISRKKSAVALLAAVESSKIHRDEVSAFQLRQMLSYGDTAISQQVGKLWPELAQVSQEKAAIIAAMRTKLTPETLAKGDASAGRLLFSKSCMNCHTLFGEGKKLAPDLTGAQRSNLNYLLENIVDPSLTVSENFRMSIVLLNDGRVLNGVIVERGEKTLTLQTATERIALQKEDIEEQRDSKLSMMPDNLLSPLKDDQIRDLILYLMSPSQVPLAGEK